MYSEEIQIKELSVRSSVALCTFNGEKYVAEFLESVLSQSILPDEIVVVDDCSSDATLSILKSYELDYPMIKIYPLVENLGPIRAFQKAIELTQFPRIFLADQDDIWDPLKIQLMMPASVNLGEELPSLVFSDLSPMNSQGRTMGNSFWKMANLDPRKATFNSMMFANVVTGCASLINSRMRELLKEIPNGVLMHDHWIGLIAYGFGNVEVINRPLVKYRIHDDSVTEKSKADFFWKMKKQFSQILGDQSEYLQKEIDQMVVFNRLFGNQLSQSKKNQLESFLQLNNQSLFKRKIAGLRKFSS